MRLFFFFFFQAEDGIRDATVTGVQTCALPIYLAGREPEQVCIQAMTLVPVGVAPLLRELGVGIGRILVDLRVSQGERIPLVVVVRLVFGVRVVCLETDTVREALGNAECPAPIFALRGGFDRGEVSQTVLAVGAQTRAPRSAELRGVAVDEAGQVRRLGIVVFEEHCQSRNDLPLDGAARRRGSRILEVAVGDEDARMVRGAEAGGWNEFRKGRCRSVARDDTAVDLLADASVGRAGRGENEAGDAGVEEAEVTPEDGLSIVPRVEGNSNARLPHLLVGRDVSVRREGLSIDRLADEAGEENLRGRRDRIGLDLCLPPQARLDSEVGQWLPDVLNEGGRLLLRDLLRPRLIHRQAAHAGLLDIKENVLLVRRILQVIEKGVGRGEFENAVAESAERLGRGHLVVLRTRLEGVLSLYV